jgi:hypothetical protein
MNSLYHKIATASISIALSLTLGTNNEAKAATFSLRETTSFRVGDINHDGLGDDYYANTVPLPVGTNRQYGDDVEYRALYEFNIANLFLPSNTVINSAIFQVRVNEFHGFNRLAALAPHAYIGDGEPDASDYEAGESLWGLPIVTSFGAPATTIFNFNVLPFINQRITNNDTFVGFGVRQANDFWLYLHLESSARLIIETADIAEPVPEPTTIFGSALALGVGGWLKRKKSSQQNKTTPQN